MALEPRSLSPAVMFLSTPSQIRRAIGLLAARASRMELAVAFIGQDWRDAIADFGGPLRVICWLSSTNTDPEAVEQMMRRPHIQVRQRDSMHAKVYLAPGVGAVVGSANLSRRALAEIEESGQDEAAVMLRDRPNLNAIETWFRLLWQSEGTRRISSSDLARALVAFRKARLAGRGAWKRRPHLIHWAPRLRAKDVAARKRAQLTRLARRVRGIDLRRQFTILRRTSPNRINKDELERIVDEFENWMGRRFLFERAFLGRPLTGVRKALNVLFDESRDIEERLTEVIRSRGVAPLRVSTLSVLLYWRRPEKYPPYNWRTQRFLRDFGLLESGASNASPVAYGRWLMKAEKHSQELSLPTPGHLDRLVWEYTENIRRRR